MAQIINKIDLTTEELETLRKAKQILEEVYDIAESCGFVDNRGYFDLDDYDYPAEFIDIFNVYDSKYSF